MTTTRDGLITEQVIKINLVRDKCSEIINPSLQKDMKSFDCE